MEIDARERPAARKPATLLLNVATTKTIDPEDVDGLITGLQNAKQLIDKLCIHKEAIEDAIVHHARALNTKTRRVQGEKRVAKITMPDDSENSARLKAIAESKEFRLIWPQLIRITGYAVKKKEYKKAVATKGTYDWNKYRDAVKSAIGPPTRRPSVAIEK